MVQYATRLTSWLASRFKLMWLLRCSFVWTCSAFMNSSMLLTWMPHLLWVCSDLCHFGFLWYLMVWTCVARPNRFCFNVGLLRRNLIAFVAAIWTQAGMSVQIDWAWGILGGGTGKRWVFCVSTCSHLFAAIWTRAPVHTCMTYVVTGRLRGFLWRAKPQRRWYHSSSSSSSSNSCSSSSSSSRCSIVVAAAVVE